MLPSARDIQPFGSSDYQLCQTAGVSAPFAKGGALGFSCRGGGEKRERSRVSRKWHVQQHHLTRIYSEIIPAAVLKEMSP